MIQITIQADRESLEAKVITPNGANTFEIYAAIVQLEKYKLQLIEMLPKGESFIGQVPQDEQ